jgi:protein-tyrosine phosphatase
LLGQQLSLLYYKHKCRSWDEVVPGVLIGRKLNNREAEEAVRSGVTAVLDLTSEFSEAKPFLSTRYLNIPILDLTAPTQEQLRQMAEFIEQNRGSGKVYAHCKIGYSRSAGAVGAYLIDSSRATSAEQAIEILRRARPGIIIRPEIVQALHLFESATQTANEARS